MCEPSGFGHNAGRELFERASMLDLYTLHGGTLRSKVYMTADEARTTQTVNIHEREQASHPSLYLCVGG